MLHALASERHVIIVFWRWHIRLVFGCVRPLLLCGRIELVAADCRGSRRCAVFSFGHGFRTHTTKSKVICDGAVRALFRLLQLFVGEVGPLHLVQKCSLDRVEVHVIVKRDHTIHIQLRHPHHRQLICIHRSLIRRTDHGTKRHITLQLHQHARQTGLILILHQRFTTLLLLDIIHILINTIQRPILVDQLRGDLRSNAWHTRHVVGRITCQRQHITQLIRVDVPLLDHSIMIDSAHLHGIDHLTHPNATIAVRCIGSDELHEILVT
mmetsp:Transcript_12255/g.33708  ORF Transcript_12255/g.33708 Transcript_12255/m.33708 type:complete len:267 (+) Transcript_12255:1218-2018(+)